MGNLTIHNVTITPRGRVGSNGKFLYMPAFAKKKDDAPGVYVFVIHRADGADDAYVGQTGSLVRRMRQYVTGSFSNSNPQAQRIGKSIKDAVVSGEPVDLCIASAVTIEGEILQKYRPQLVTHRKVLEAFLVADYLQSYGEVLNDDAQDDLSDLLD